MRSQLAFIVRRPHCVAAAALFSVALAVFLVAHLGLRLPVSSEADVRAATLRALMDELASTEMRFRMAKDYEDKSRRVAMLEEKLEPSLSTPEFTAEMERLAERSGLALEQLSSRRNASIPGVESTAYELLLVGEYPQIKSFLSGAAGLNGFVSIGRMAIEKRSSALHANVVLVRHQQKRGDRDS